MIFRRLAAPLAAFVMLLALSPASAAPVPFAIQKNRNCPPEEACLLAFQRLPDKVSWEIRQVSCVVNVNPASAKLAIAGVTVANSSGQPLFNYPMAPQTTGALNGVRFWVVQSLVYIPVRPGQQVRFVGQVDPTPEFFFIDCTLSGERDRL